MSVFLSAAVMVLGLNLKPNYIPAAITPMTMDECKQYIAKQVADNEKLKLHDTVIWRDDKTGVLMYTDNWPTLPGTVLGITYTCDQFGGIDEKAKP